MHEAPASEVVQKFVNGIFIEKFELSAEDLSAEKKLFEDLGLDSLDAVDLMIAFQKKFNIKIKSEQVKNISTLGDIYRLASTYEEGLNKNMPH